MPVPPATPQMRLPPAPDGTCNSSQMRGRRSFAPGSSLLAESPAGLSMSGRKSIAPRMSAMPSAPHKPGLPLLGAQVVNMTEYNAKVAEVNRLKLQLETTNEKLEEERAVRQKKEDESITLSKKLNEVESRIARYQREAGRSERRVKREEEEKIKGEADLKRAIDELQSTLGDVQDDKDVMASKLNALKAQFAASEQELIQTKADLATLLQETDDLHNANDQLESRQHTLETENADLKVKVNRYEGELEALRATLSDERQEAEAHAKELIERHSQEIDQRSDELEALDATKKAALKDAAAKISALNKACEQLAIEKEAGTKRAEEQSAQLQSLIEEHSQLKTMHGDVVSESKKMGEKLAETLEKVDKMVHEAIDKDAQMAQKSEHFNRERREAHAQIERLRRDVLTSKQQATDTSANLKLKEDELREAERAKTTLQGEVEDLTEEVSKLGKTLESLRSEDAKNMQEVYERNTSLKQSTEALHDNLRELKRKLAKLEKENSKLAAELANANARIDELSAENDSLEDKNTDLDYKLRLEEHNVKKTTLISQKLREKLDQRDGEIRALKESKKTLMATANERIDNMNKENQRLAAAANDYRAEYELLKARLNRYRKMRNLPAIDEKDDETEQQDETYDAAQEDNQQELEDHKPCTGHDDEQ